MIIISRTPLNARGSNNTRGSSLNALGSSLNVLISSSNSFRATSRRLTPHPSHQLQFTLSQLILLFLAAKDELSILGLLGLQLDSQVFNEKFCFLVNAVVAQFCFQLVVLGLKCMEGLIHFGYLFFEVFDDPLVLLDYLRLLVLHPFFIDSHASVHLHPTCHPATVHGSPATQRQLLHTGQSALQIDDPVMHLHIGPFPILPIEIDLIDQSHDSISQSNIDLLHQLLDLTHRLIPPLHFRQKPRGYPLTNSHPYSLTHLTHSTHSTDLTVFATAPL